jgi:CIC family chloride channel protein
VVEIIERFASGRSDSLPVTDPDGALLGVVAAVDLEHAVARDSTQLRLAGELMREAPTVRAEDSLEQAVEVLAAGDDEGIPVIDDERRMVGWLTHRRVLRAYRVRAGRDGGAGTGVSSRARIPAANENGHPAAHQVG